MEKQIQAPIRFPKAGHADTGAICVSLGGSLRACMDLYADCVSISSWLFY